MLLGEVPDTKSVYSTASLLNLCEYAELAPVRMIELCKIFALIFYDVT